MKTKSALLLGPLLLGFSCSLHDTSYLQKGDPSRGGAGGSSTGTDLGGDGATTAGTATNAGAGGAAEGGAAAGGAGTGEGGDQSTLGGASMAGAGAGTGAVGTGAPCDGAEVKCESSEMITDFESNDGHLCVMGGGSVIAYGDGTGTQAPKIGDVKSYNASDDCDRGSAYALHALGAGASDYGFGVAFRFPQNVDAVKAGYTGIRFKAKTGSSRKISIKVATPATLDASFGGSCVPTTSPSKLCNDHPAAGVVIAAGGWLDYEVTFDSLKQEGWGVPAESNFGAISQVHVIFPGPVSGGDADFDVWLDDLEFYK